MTDDGGFRFNVRRADRTKAQSTMRVQLVDAIGRPVPGFTAGLVIVEPSVARTTNGVFNLPSVPNSDLYPPGTKYQIFIDGLSLDIAGLVTDMASLVAPEDFGAPIDGVSPAADYIQAAIDAIASGERNGPLWLGKRYALEHSLVWKPGVMALGPGAYDRRAFPNHLIAGLYPHSSLDAGSALIEVGTFGSPDVNPQGTLFQGICLDGRLANGDHMPELVGLHVKDTSDVHFNDGYIGGFDRTDSTGIGALVEGTDAGNCYGVCFSRTIISNNQWGILYTGLGTTDMRIDSCLYVGCTRALTLGYDDRDGTDNLGGGGAQLVNNHYTYTGMPDAGWHLRTGSQAGDFMSTNNYYDMAGNSYTIRMGNARAILNAEHFLVADANEREGLIRITSAGSQQTTVVNCNVNLQGSGLQGLVWYSAKVGTPTGGVIANNLVFGAGDGSWVGHVLDQNSDVIADTDNGSFYKEGNVKCT